MLAQRTAMLKGSGTAAARAAAKEASDAGIQVVDLTAGEIWTGLAPTIRDGAIAAIDKGINRYTDTIGVMELREALARKLTAETGQNWGASEIAVTTGAKQALFNAAMVLLNPGDEVIIPAPYWTTFPAQVQIAGGVPVHVDTRANGFVPRIEDISAAVTARTRAIVVNTPNNPTGTVYDAALLRALGELAIERDLWIIFDECYRDFIHTDVGHHPIVSVIPEVRSRTVIVNAFSKALALTGWRIGYLAGPDYLVSAVKALQSHTTSNPNVIAQHAALHHLQNTDGSFEAGLQKQLSSAREIGIRVLSGLSRIPVPTAMGGFYFYLDVKNLVAPEPWNLVIGDRDVDLLVRELIAKAGVATVSGTAFGDPYGMRLSYGIPPDRLPEGLDRLVEFLNAWSYGAPPEAEIKERELL
ncbi:aspartate aminotransferase [Phyllobacterium phragmitis]|uniref:aspartate transaminase n=1 Tax=Phyllobacterium phragmitis TaxID=2670329 RepID=A0A2S9IT42_9HYPH|nr:aminotransferase class I/II-fold pyridoxal phosphate-dependent enzyme [Phyllobacterium phragmitis]PRD43697.1 aspartate aminotransferase [Phyllobacterium phragmitis]